MRVIPVYPLSIVFGISEQYAYSWIREMGFELFRYGVPAERLEEFIGMVAGPSKEAAREYLVSKMEVR